MSSRTVRAIDLMTQFAERTGVASAEPARRYLWTDAFAVSNFLALDRATGDARFGELALQLVDQVHHTLGRHRDDDVRRGWISGLPEAEGEAHPTAGGLRIGKRLPERGPTERFAERLEWDRDGQYFHYLTKWMHALDQVTRSTGDPAFNRWACELAQAARRAFTYAVPDRPAKRMIWKASIDLSRPLVASMGQHDPLDGFITCAQLAATLPAASPRLLDARADFAAMVVPGGLATTDPLGLGGLLVDAWRVHQLTRQGAFPEGDDLLEALLEAAMAGMHAYLAQQDLRLPASRRLAFRELGLAIGIAAIAHLADESSTLSAHARANLDRLSRTLPVRDTIESFWLDSEHRRTEPWLDHADINDVMLATSLCPDGFLVLRPAPSRRA